MHLSHKKDDKEKGNKEGGYKEIKQYGAKD